jgi:hypothetical protein
MIPDWAIDLLERAVPNISWFEVMLISLGLWGLIGYGLHLIGVF